MLPVTALSFSLSLSFISHHSQDVPSGSHLSSHLTPHLTRTVSALSPSLSALISLGGYFSQQVVDLFSQGNVATKYSCSLSLSLQIFISVCLSVRISVCLFIYLSIYADMPTYLSVSVCLTTVDNISITYITV